MKQCFLNQAKTFLPFLSKHVAQRCDSIAFARSFEYVEQELQRTEFEPLFEEEHIPYDTSVPDGAQSVTHRTVTQVGQADFVDGYASDLPIVDVEADEFTVKPYLLGEKYQYSVEELDAVAMDPTIRLDAERKESAIEGMRRKHAEVAAIGSSKHGRLGFINSDVVPLVSPTTGDWTTATDDQIIADFQKGFYSIENNTLQNHRASHVLLATDLYDRLCQPYGSDKSHTLKSWLLDNMKDEGLKEIRKYKRLDLADAGGTGPRAIFYKKDIKVVKYFPVISFRERNPQDVDLHAEVPCYGKSGFTNFRLPQACAYMDGLGE